jgi:hypothetical protein
LDAGIGQLRPRHDKNCGDTLPTIVSLEDCSVGKSEIMWQSQAFKTLLFAGLLIHMGAAQDFPGGDVVVVTPSGAVRGTTMTSRSGRTIYAFRGLRYAKPPVGDLRFKVG